MVKPINIVATVFAATLIDAIPTTNVAANMAERNVANADGTTSKVLTSRSFEELTDSVKRSQKGRNKEDFFFTDTYESLCTHDSDAGHTKINSPYVEDCAYINTYIFNLKGFFNLYRLSPGQEYELVKHNTCSLYYKPDATHNSIQIATGDLGYFVNNTINSYKRSFGDGKFDRVEGTASLTCFGTDGIQVVGTTLILKR
ncbi:hypothetical protein BKA67DRAFT_578437 [Truncatella angustata]|uniref:Ecp2 effector protein-like domain-containing protein n=1 Tax=Truncatella angustata TaxID=152316 RepID=A0A9P8RKI6_9PEZI|nr:uncharacterized protein BKA67DRAFT_578437 [Truncatella angustata]KAH6647740.1 hypothetical protein BKA67DRAFT_578437 [Truncatella angustata]